RIRSRPRWISHPKRAAAACAPCAGRCWPTTSTAGLAPFSMHWPPPGSRSRPGRAEDPLSLVPAYQGHPRTLGDRLLGQVFLAVRNRIGFDHRIVLVVQIEQVGGNAQAHGVAFTTVAIDFHSHDNLLGCPRI